MERAPLSHVLNNLKQKLIEDKKCDSLGTNIIIHFIEKKNRKRRRSVIAIFMLKKTIRKIIQPVENCKGDIFMVT